MDMHLIWVRRKQKYFCFRGLTRFRKIRSDLPVGLICRSSIPGFDLPLAGKSELRPIWNQAECQAPAPDFVEPVVGCAFASRWPHPGYFATSFFCSIAGWRLSEARF